jgi:hypothetical protein
VKRRAFVVAGALLALCCARSSVPERARQAASWLATTRAVVEEWSRNSVPQSYAQQSLESTADMIRREREALRGQDVKGAADLERSLGQASVLLSEMQEAVRAGDRATALAKGAELSAMETVLRQAPR